VQPAVQEPRSAGGQQPLPSLVDVGGGCRTKRLRGRSIVSAPVHRPIRAEVAGTSDNMQATVKSSVAAHEGQHVEREIAPLQQAVHAEEMSVVDATSQPPDPQSPKKSTTKKPSLKALAVQCHNCGATGCPSPLPLQVVCHYLFLSLSHTRTHTHIHTLTHPLPCTHTHAQTFRHTNTHAQTNTHTYTHENTDTHTHTHSKMFYMPFC
jgi:hypothetical protein